MVYSFLSKSSNEAKGDTTTVVVASMDIAPGTQMTSEMVRLELVPKNLVQAGAMHKIEEAVGQRLKMAVNAGDQITRKRLTSIAAHDSFIGSIPNDKRAMTINVDDVSGVAGFIRPASYVDVLSVDGDGKNKRTVGKLLLQNVLVLAVGSTDMASDSGKNVESAKTVTLALDPREAVELRVAQQEGKITLALRPNKPTDVTYVGSTVYGKAASQPQQSSPDYAPAPAASVPQYSSAPSANSGVTVIRGTNVGH